MPSYGREYDVLSGPTAAQLTMLAGLHDRVVFTLKRLREIADPLPGLKVLHQFLLERWYSATMLAN